MTVTSWSSYISDHDHSHPNHASLVLTFPLGSDKCSSQHSMKELSNWSLSRITTQDCWHSSFFFHILYPLPLRLSQRLFGRSACLFISTLPTFPDMPKLKVPTANSLGTRNQSIILALILLPTAMVVVVVVVGVQSLGRGSTNLFINSGIWTELQFLLEFLKVHDT